MIIIKAEGAPPCCRSERDFMRAIHDQHGVYIANANVPNSTAPGAFTREVDGILLTPEGIYTVEVKGVRATGELTTPRMDAWAIVNGDTKTPLAGRPHAQALAHSKYLASFLKDTGIPSGWIRAVLALVADRVTLPGGVSMHLTENVHVVLAQPGVGEVLRTEVAPTTASPELSLEAVQRILTAFECVETAPSVEDLIAQGFRTDADITAAVEERRKQAREEFRAAQTAAQTAAGHALATTGDGPIALPVADAPSTTEWAITTDRFHAATALDPELTETGAVVDGVAIHKRLVSYADRKNIPLADIAALVNNPVEVLGDDTDSHHVYCGTEHAVAVRTVDRLAMFYKTVDLAKAERSGATVDGTLITARAAKQAINQFSISLEAVARIVTHPEERWWVPGTTDIAHARGEFVAVTNGHLGPVQYVVTRAMAVHRAAPKAAVEEPAETPRTDRTVRGVTIRASVVGWSQRTHVPLDAIASIVTNPVAVWPGHTEGMEVRSGNTHAVLLDTSQNAIVAVMTPAEAVEYRDGVVRSGVRLSGRCLFLAKRRKRSVDEIVEAVKAPVTVARALGSGFTYYIGAEVAVTVEDTTSAAVDFTYADHARAMMRRGELVWVEGAEVDPSKKAPTPPLAPVPPVPPVRPVPGPHGVTMAKVKVNAGPPSPLMFAARRHSA